MRPRWLSMACCLLRCMEKRLRLAAQPCRRAELAPPSALAGLGSGWRRPALGAPLGVLQLGAFVTFERAFRLFPQCLGVLALDVLLQALVVALRACVAAFAFNVVRLRSSRAGVVGLLLFAHDVPLDLVSAVESSAAASPACQPGTRTARLGVCLSTKQLPCRARHAPHKRRACRNGLQ